MTVEAFLLRRTFDVTEKSQSRESIFSSLEFPIVDVCLAFVRRLSMSPKPAVSSLARSFYL